MEFEMEFEMDLNKRFYIFFWQTLGLLRLVKLKVILQSLKLDHAVRLENYKSMNKQNI